MGSAVFLRLTTRINCRKRDLSANGGDYAKRTSYEILRLGLDRSAQRPMKPIACGSSGATSRITALQSIKLMPWPMNRRIKVRPARKTQCDCRQVHRGAGPAVQRETPHRINVPERPHARFPRRIIDPKIENDCRPLLPPSNGVGIVGKIHPLLFFGDIDNPHHCRRELEALPGPCMRMTGYSAAKDRSK